MSLVYTEDKGKQNVKPSFAILEKQKEDDQDPWIVHPYRMMALSFSVAFLPSYIVADEIVGITMGVTHAATMYFLQYQMHYQQIDKDDIDKVDYNSRVSMMDAILGALIGFYFTSSTVVPLSLAVIGALSPYSCEKVDSLFGISKKPMQRTVNNASQFGATNVTNDLRRSSASFYKT